MIVRGRVCFLWASLFVIALAVGAHAARPGISQDRGESVGVQLEPVQDEAPFTIINGTGDDDAAGTTQHGWSESLLQSFSMILVSEAGDETFIIAAIMAMRHNKVVVFAAAMTALTAMTVISTALGVVIPNLISPSTTNALATGLYIVFGLRLYWIAYHADPSGTEEEIEEVEEKLAAGTASKPGAGQIIRTALSRFMTPVFLEASVLTFLAEWGDRSQIATITLASHMDPIGVTIGAVVGHSICTGAACIGGELLAKKISQRTVAITGGTLFFLFAIHNYLAG